MALTLASGHMMKRIVSTSLGIVVMLFITGCSGGGDNDVPPSVTLRGQALVDDVSAAPIAHAECSFFSFGGRLRNRTTADANGMFELMLPSSAQGLLGCYPPGLPNLTLLTFISTDDALPGSTLPEQGVEEVSPQTTVIANIIVQTAPAEPQRRKTELLHDLAAQEPDITLLSGVATALFNRMHQMSISEVPFTADSANESEGEGGGSDGGGVSGEAGDGAEFSPLDDVQCEFVLNLQGDCALEDLLSDGSLDRSDLQAIAADVAQDAAPRDAFVRLFPQGVQPSVEGQPLRTRTDAQGAYFLPIPPNTPGFIQCTPRPDLVLSTFVRARQAQETLTGQDVSPPSQFLTTFVLPLVAPKQQAGIQDNFRFDIGNLQQAVAGVVRVETALSPEGTVMADTDGDGVACSFLGGPEAAAVRYNAPGGAAFVATTLYKALLLESRTPATASYTTLLGVLLNRTTATGNPLIEATGDDLVLGGVPDTRAPILATLWNTCVRSSIEQGLGLPLAQVVQLGRLRVTATDEDGLPLPNAQIRVEGAFVAAQSSCRALLESSDNHLVCQANDEGRVTFTLSGEQALTATPVVLTAVSADRTLQGQIETILVPPATLDVMVTARPL
jgi:hypothetical protein